MSTVTPGHVNIDDRCIAWIDDTNIKVIEIALERIAHGSSVDEIVEQHLGLLSFAQVHAALAHYYDYQAAFDAEIDSQLEHTDRLQAAAAHSPGRIRLRAAGRLR